MFKQAVFLCGRYVYDSLRSPFSTPSSRNAYVDRLVERSIKI